MKMSKQFLSLTVILLTICFQSNSCVPQSQDKWIEMGGPAHNTNVLVFFKKDTKHEQIEGFYNTVLSKSSPYGKNTGLDFRDGIASRFRVLNNGYEGVGINFSIDAYINEREQLKKDIRQSPIVYKVYENVIPNEIKEL